MRCISTLTFLKFISIAIYLAITILESPCHMKENVYPASRIRSFLQVQTISYPRFSNISEDAVSAKFVFCLLASITT